MTDLEHTLIKSIAKVRAERGIRPMGFTVYLIVDSNGCASVGLTLESAWLNGGHLTNEGVKVVQLRVDVPLPTMAKMSVIVPADDDEPIELRDLTEGD